MTSREPVIEPFAWTFTAPLYVGSSLNPINSSLIATALVPIALSLHVPVGSTSVLVSALYLASAIAQPTAGKLAEVIGPRRVFLGGILLVLLGGIVGGLAHSLPLLIAARVLIGAGTSSAFPSAMVLVRRRATDAGLAAPPGAVLGGLAIAGMATAAIGPPIGGVLVGAAGWRWAFLINLPAAAIALVMAVRWVPRDPARERAGWRVLAARIDLLGILGCAAFMTSLIIFLMGLPHPDWIALAVFVVLAAPTLWWELHTEQPFIDLRGLAANGALTRTYLRQGLTLIGVYTVMFGVTEWIEAGRGVSIEMAGLLLLPMGAVSALLSFPLSRRNLVRGPLIVSAVSMLIGSAGIMLLGAHSPLIAIVLVSLVFGVTAATTTVGNQTALYMEASPEQIGTASGLFRTFGYLGTIVSAVIGSLAFRGGVDDSGLHTLGIVLVAAGVAVLLLTVLDRKLGNREKNRRDSPDHGIQQGDSPVSTPAIPAIDPKQTALLAMDFQQGILSRFEDADALLDRVGGAIADMRAAGGTVGYVRVAFTEDDWSAVPDTNKTFSQVAAGKLMHHEEDATQIDGRIAPQDGDVVVRKIRFGGISTTDLHEQLRDRGIDTVVLAGVSTSGVVLSTLIDAADRDYRVFVLADAVADTDAQAHETLVNNVFPSRAHVIDTAKLRTMLSA